MREKGKGVSKRGEEKKNLERRRSLRGKEIKEIETVHFDLGCTVLTDLTSGNCVIYNKYLK